MQQAIICDIDGTLAIKGKRSPYAYHQADRDTPNAPVALLVRLMSGQGYAIILFTGREASSEELTKAWLAKHEIPYDVLAMRPTGDNRRDTVVKREMYEQTVRGRYSIAFVLDDRNQVVAMWRKDLHLPCFQVNYGDF